MMRTLALLLRRRAAAPALTVAAASALSVAGAVADEMDAVLFLEAPGGPPARAEILFLPEDLDRLTPPATREGSKLVITGAYSSGDRFAPEGFVIRRGEATHPWPQGWDGLLLTDATGAASLHDVGAVRHGGRVFDLRDRTARAAFLEIAAAERLSAIQSHLLINEGRLDLRDVSGAPRFRRRLLLQLGDGRLAVYDTAPRAVTLYEAAVEALEALRPRMALNLDMGTFDFCERWSNGEPERCGLLRREGIEKLTNLIAISTGEPR